jgi:cytochrome oxidase assembly protein ShyY1
VDKQVPANDPAFGAFPGPEIDDGPHFFYALQWFFFALLALGGLVYFSRQEVHGDKSAGDSAAPESPAAPRPEARAGASD